MSIINIKSHKMLLETLRILVKLDYNIDYRGKIIVIIDIRVEINYILKARTNKI